jgi:hypothetical protein
MERPGTFYWNIKSPDQEQVIARRGFTSAKEAKDDLDQAISILSSAHYLVNGVEAGEMEEN